MHHIRHARHARHVALVDQGFGARIGEPIYLPGGATRHRQAAGADVTKF